MRPAVVLALLAALAGATRAQGPTDGAGRPSPVEDAILALGSADAMVRLEAVHRLVSLRLTATDDRLAAAVLEPLFAVALGDRDPAVAAQAVAATGLRRAGAGNGRSPTTKPVSGARRGEHRGELSRQLADPIPALRLRAVQDLHGLLLTSAEARGWALDRLAEALGDEDPHVAKQARVALAPLSDDRIEVGWAREAREARRLAAERREVDDLALALAAEDAMARLEAVHRLGEQWLHAHEPERIVSLLIAAASDRDRAVATQARWLLERWSEKTEAVESR